MHKYLAAIGFSQINNRKDFNKLVELCVRESTERAYTSNGDDTMLAILSKEFAPGIGLTVCGEYDENNTFTYEYSYPFLKRHNHKRGYFHRKTCRQGKLCRSMR